MATPFTIVRVTALPSTLAANTMYIIRESGNLAKITFTGNTASVLASTYSKSDAAVDITKAVADSKSAYVFATVTAMRAVSPLVDAFAFVKDASGDPAVTSPTAAYAWDSVAKTWSLVPGSASAAPVDLNWNNIIGRPTSTPAQIDQAVQRSHVHSNAAVLDRLGESSDQLLTYRGTIVSPIFITTDW